MQLAKVIGTVVATRKHEALRGIKILMIQPLNDDLKPVDKPIAALDQYNIAWCGARGIAR